MTGRSFAAVLFDLDGTLINSIEAVERSWREWARLEGVDLADIGNFHGTPSRQIVAKLVPPEQVERSSAVIDSLELADTDGVVILPGSETALEALLDVPGGRQYAAIATSGSRPLATMRLKATGLRVPDVVVTASDVSVGKPDPAPYVLAAERLGVDPRECLVVEDAPAGIESGNAAGAATLGILTSSGPDELRAADAVVRDLDAVRFQAGPGGVSMRESQV
nr:HAD-IA family hydrolase [Spelaeicoccus albus]